MYKGKDKFTIRGALLESNRVAQWRKRAGISQTSLAERLGISRQSLHMIEGGEQVPKVYLALAIAGALGCKINDIFPVERPKELRYEKNATRDGSTFRACVAEINGAQVVRKAISAGFGSSIPPSDVVALSSPSGLTLEPDFNKSEFFIDGCDPALGLFANRANEQNKDFKVRWFYGSNSESVARLRGYWSHCALVHFDSMQEMDSERGPSNLVEVPFGEWEIALCIAPGNPKGIRSIEDLNRSDIRIALREIGSGLRTFIDKKLASLGLQVDSLQAATSIYDNHYQVAAAVSLGVCDVGIVPLSIALEQELEYVSVGVHTSILHLSPEGLRVGAAGGLFDVLTSRTFIAEVSALGGYRLAG